MAADPGTAHAPAPDVMMSLTELERQALNIAALAAAAAAAVIGDNARYWIGKTGGRRLAERYGHYVHLNRTRLKAGRYLFARHGVKVVFFGRLVAVLRTDAAFLAGLSAMRWSRSLVANAAGGVLCSGIYAFGAYALGNAASSIGSTITIVDLAVAGVLTAATIVTGRRSLQRIEQQAEDAFPDEPSPSSVPAGRAA
jgi:membrane protein DedA with SNARE-associated domain